jgi:hypothetical protein
MYKKTFGSCSCKSRGKFQLTTTKGFAIIVKEFIHILYARHKRLKSNNSYMPVLLFSAHAKEQEVAECNANGFVTKPFDIKDLVNTIHRHLN